jgi:hypothetical protein
VHALSRDEALGLTRELPNLRALLHTDAGPLRTEPGTAQDAEAEQQCMAADRDRVRRVLRVVQGHPKVLELADAAAADRDRLDARLAAAEETATLRSSARLDAQPAVGETMASQSPSVRLNAEPTVESAPVQPPSGRIDTDPAGETAAGRSPASQLDAFFRDGHTDLEAAQFLDALACWTTGALDALRPEARLMAEFVACLEDDDRQSDVIAANWADLWRRLESPGAAPAPEPLLNTLATAALVEAALAGVPDADEQPSAADEASSGDADKADFVDAAGPGERADAEDEAGAGNRPVPVTYRVHPGVAAAIMVQAGPGVREAVDAGLAAFWAAVFGQAQEGQDGENGGLVVWAGLAGAPYLLRRGDWDAAALLLEHVAVRDRSPGAVQAVLPSLRRIVAATGAPKDAFRLARVLRRGVDAGEAERLLRTAMDATGDAGDYQVASAAAGDLVTLLRDAGRLAEALAVAGRKAEFTKRAGFGPWTRLADQAWRLQVLERMGEHALVLAETETLRAAMAVLPERGGASEAVSPWNVREAILNTGWFSALATGDWQRCLDLNAEIAASQRRRGAGVHEVIRTRFNDAGPLIELWRLGEAGPLLAECQRVFEEHADTPMLAKVLSARADLEDKLGHRQAAADLERTALRLAYARPEPRDIAVSHHSLANYLGRLGDRHRRDDRGCPPGRATRRPATRPPGRCGRSRRDPPRCRRASAPRQRSRHHGAPGMGAEDRHHRRRSSDRPGTTG